MSKNRSASSKKKKSTAAPAVPPTLIRLHHKEDYEKYVLSFKGSALVAVLAPVNASSCKAVLSGLEELNLNRSADLVDTNLCVVFANEESSEICELLQVSTSPFFASFSYGQCVHQFSGDSVEKATLIARHSAQAATEEAKRLAEAAASAAEG